MSSWWDGLTNLQQVLYLIAIPSTVVMLIQTVMLIIGLGGHGDVDGSGPIDGSVGHDIPPDATVGGEATMGHVSFDAHDAGHIAHDGSSMDYTDFAAFRLFSLRSILAFFVVFGWVGIAMSKSVAIPALVVLLVSFLAGSLALYLTALMFYGIMKLQYSGNVHLHNAVGHDAEVYIPIPPANQGVGKVNLLLQGRWVECDAVTTGHEPLATGSSVRVVGIQGESILIVVSK